MFAPSPAGSQDAPSQDTVAETQRTAVGGDHPGASCSRYPPRPPILSGINLFCVPRCVLSLSFLAVSARFVDNRKLNVNRPKQFETFLICAGEKSGGRTDFR